MQDYPRTADAEFQRMVRERYAGNPGAITALAARIMVGRDAPFSPMDSLELLREATQQGDAQAWTYLALLAATGLACEQSWADALNALSRAAALNDASAIRQLTMLEVMGIRRASDAQEWISRFNTRILLAQPRVAAHAGFLPSVLCRYLIEHAAPRRERAQVFDAKTGELRVDPMRTNTHAVYSLIDTDVVLQLVRAHIAHAANAAFNTLEPMEVLHYASGETYKPHIDFFHPSRPGYAEEMRIRGQRIKTFLIYLNSDFDGGETDFPKLGIKFRGAVGEAITFDNTGADGTGDMNTLHAGLPVMRGEKWLLSQWIREKAQPVV